MRFTLLGPVTVTCQERGLSAGAPMTRSLLAVLLAEAGHTVPDGQLIAALWGEQPPATATASLHNHVMRLRRLLGDSGAARIRRSLDGYLIEVRPGELDLHDFEDATRRGRAALADGDWARAADELARGLALWQGEPLLGLRACTRQAAGAERLSEARLRAVEQLAEARLRLHAYGQVIADLGPMVRRHPWAENLHGHLMHALYGAGRQADALAAFHQLRRELRAELGVEPSAVVRELHHRILAGDPTLLPARQPHPRCSGPAAARTGAAQRRPAARAERRPPLTLPHGGGGGVRHRASGGEAREDQQNRGRSQQRQEASGGRGGGTTMTAAAAAGECRPHGGPLWTRAAPAAGDRGRRAISPSCARRVRRL